MTFLQPTNLTSNRSHTGKYSYCCLSFTMTINFHLFLFCQDFYTNKRHKGSQSEEEFSPMTPSIGCKLPSMTSSTGCKSSLMTSSTGHKSSSTTKTSRQVKLEVCTVKYFVIFQYQGVRVRSSLVAYWLLVPEDCGSNPGRGEKKIPLTFLSNDRMIAV